MISNYFCGINPVDNKHMNHDDLCCDLLGYFHSGAFTGYTRIFNRDRMIFEGEFMKDVLYNGFVKEKMIKFMNQAFLFTG